MADDNGKTSGLRTLMDELPLDRLRDELQDAARALGEKAMGNVTQRLGDATTSLTDIADNGGVLGKAAKEGTKAAAKGDSPVAGALKGGLGGVKDKVKSAFGGGKGNKATKSTNIIESIDVGVKGTCDLMTSVLAQRCEQISRREGGQLITVGVTPERRTTRWAICTGAGASSDTLREAKAAQVDTLIVGEGPHHTAIEAEEYGIAVLYVGHYASETFGVRALGAEIERTFGIPWSFIAAPTGL